MESACYFIGISPNSRLSAGYRVKVSFQIGLHENDRALLELIKTSLGVGSITKQGQKSIQYRVTSIKELKVIISHFEKYPLMTNKWADFELFKQAVKLIERGEHLTTEGLNKLVSIKASMNRGLSDKLKIPFSGVTLVLRPVAPNQSIPDPHWVAGFTAAEGCFFVPLPPTDILQERAKGNKKIYKIYIRWISRIKIYNYSA